MMVVRDRQAIARLAENEDFHVLVAMIEGKSNALIASLVKQTDPIMIYRIQGQIAFHNWLFSLFNDAVSPIK